MVFFRISYVRPLPSLRLRALPHRGLAASGGSRIRIGGCPHRPPPEPPSSPHSLGVRDSAPPKAVAIFFGYVRPAAFFASARPPLRVLTRRGVSHPHWGGPRPPPPQTPLLPQRPLGARVRAPKGRCHFLRSIRQCRSLSPVKQNKTSPMLPNAYTPLADASIEQIANVRQVLSSFPNICLFEWHL